MEHGDEMKGNGKSVRQTIRNDLTNLKEDAYTLARDIRDTGGSVARDGIDQLRSASEDRLQRIEEYVRDKPSQSIMMAFAVGLLASFVLGGRR